VSLRPLTRIGGTTVIGSLRGVLLDRDPDGELLVEVSGIGYRVTVAPYTAIDVGDVGEEVFLHIHHNIREDAETLFGFLERVERVTFESLLGAHGVGPSLALSILAVHRPADLQRAVASDDLASLCLVPGVGKKTAERLLIELRSTLDIADIDLTDVPRAPRVANTVLDDVRAALSGLGYGNDEIASATARLPEGDDASELVRFALSELAS
jgi:Holliday junction DNA helicase RuvA